MSRFYLLFAVATIVIGAMLMLNPTRASDDDKPSVAAAPKEEISEVGALVDRIEQLERRLAALEGREPLIRQADSRETTEFEGAAPIQPVIRPKAENEDAGEIQKTNGQKWQIRLLNYRETSPSQTFENDAGTPTLNAPRVKQRMRNVKDGI